MVHGYQKTFRCSYCHSSFSATHNVSKVNSFVLLKFENNLGRQINCYNYFSKNYDKYKFALKQILLLTVINLFQLEVVQKCQTANFVYFYENSFLSVALCSFEDHRSELTKFIFLS